MKLEQAARQALEALIEANVVSERYQNAEKREQAITALREALAEQEDEIDWIETNKALAKEIIELNKQAEQDPVGIVEDSDEWGIAGVLVAGVPIGTKLYAAPVRTKDLTDDEIMDLVRDECVDMHWPSTPLFIARAVIVADREKNK